MDTTKEFRTQEAFSLIDCAMTWVYEAEDRDHCPRDRAAAESEVDDLVRKALSAADDQLLDELGRLWFDQPICKDTARILVSLRSVEDRVNVGAHLVSEINGRLPKFELNDAA